VARPLIAKEQVRIAHEEGADAVGHGATGKGNDQVRFELTYMALDPSLKIVAPWKDPTFELTSREAAVEYAKKHKIPISQSKKKIYSRDRNIWHMSHEGAELEDPANEPHYEDMLVMSKAINKAPDKPQYIEVSFEKGVPIKVNGMKMGSVKLLEELNRIGGRHGVGQVDLVENRLVGIKSRGVYETPGGTILCTAHRALETLCLDRDTSHYKQQMAIRYAELVYDGKWFTPLREAMDSFFETTQQKVSGTAKLKLYKGHCLLAGVTSPNSLYATDLASFTMGTEYDSTDATGFIRLFGLPMKVQALKNKERRKK
jgi:argininosuccinate synthase